MGEALGSLMGGFFTHYYSFDTACYSTSLLNLIYAIIFIFYNINNMKEQLGEAQEDDSLSTNGRERISSVEYVTRYRAYSFTSKSLDKSINYIKL